MENKCKLCGHEWDSRKENPKSCPRCKRYDWRSKEKTKKVKEEKSNDRK